MSTAVIIPVYNGAAVLPTTVPALLALDGVDEWVWVDDGSTDASAEILVSLLASHPRARMVHQPFNTGRSAARNRGLRETTSDTVVFFDCDARPPPDAVHALVAPLGETTVATVARIRPMLEGRDDPYAVYLAEYPRGPVAYDAGETIPWRFFPTCACALQRSAVVAAGGFDETIPYGEDVALACHLAQRSPHGLTLADVSVDLFGAGTLEDAIRNVRVFGASLRTVEAVCPEVLVVAGVDDRLSSTWLQRLATLPIPSIATGAALRRLPRSLQARAVRYLLGHAFLASYHGVRDHASPTH